MKEQMEDLEFIQKNWGKLSEGQKFILKTIGVEQNE